MPTQTPAEKSSQIKHLLNTTRSTSCGIKFKHQKFLTNNTSTERKSVDCKKCLEKDTKEQKP